MDRSKHDSRPSMTFDRSNASQFDQFIFIPALYDRPGHPCRLRLLWSEDVTNGLIEIIEENTTNETKTAEGHVVPAINFLSLTTEQAEWLSDALIDLLERIHAEQKAREV